MLGGLRRVSAYGLAACVVASPPKIITFTSAEPIRAPAQSAGRTAILMTFIRSGARAGFGKELLDIAVV